MSRAIIILVGISLLTKHIEKIIFNKNKFDDFTIRFLNGYNIAVHRKVEDIIEIINPEKKRQITEYLKDTVGPLNLNEASAETNSLSHLHLQKEDILYFLSSNTQPGKICTNVFYEYYRNFYNVKKPIIIYNLDKNIFNFNQGIRELSDKIVEIIISEKGKGNEVIINATGGYKPEGIYATLSGILNDVKAVYIHEGFNSLIKLPSIPISFNLSIFHRNAIWIRLAQKGNVQAFSRLPTELQNLIDFNPGQDSPFKPLGEILWNSYCFAISPQGRVYPKLGLIDRLNSVHQNRVSTFLAKWDYLWLGDQIPQMIDHEQSHCQDILNFAEQTLLPILEKDGEFLSEKDIYYLIAAIFLHDIGHSETIDENDKILNPEDIRENHSGLTYQMIKNNPKDFGFDKFNEEAESIATICKYHQRKWDMSGLPEVDKKGIKIRLITVLLRVFDACDMQRSRAGEEDYREMKLHANEREKKLYKKMLKEENPAGIIKEYIESKVKFIEKQKEHFKIHSEISLVHIEPEKLDNKWICKIICHPVKDKKIIQGFKKYIDGELNAPHVKETLTNNLIVFEVEAGKLLP